MRAANFISCLVLGGRSYPFEGISAALYTCIPFFNVIYLYLGSMMPWPQHAPYTDPLRVMLCGGSTPGAGIALDNCVHIAPNAPGATWTVERMVSHDSVFVLRQSQTF